MGCWDVEGRVEHTECGCWVSGSSSGWVYKNTCTWTFYSITKQLGKSHTCIRKGQVGFYCIKVSFSSQNWNCSVTENLDKMIMVFGTGKSASVNTYQIFISRSSFQYAAVSSWFWKERVFVQWQPESWQSVDFIYRRDGGACCEAVVLYGSLFSFPVREWMEKWILSTLLSHWVWYLSHWKSGRGQ